MRKDQLLSLIIRLGSLYSVAIEVRLSHLKSVGRSCIVHNLSEINKRI